MRLKFLLLLIWMVLLAFPRQVVAKDGWYMGMDLGVAIAQSMDVTGRDNDLGTVCDRIINPDDLGLSAGECEREGGEGDRWTNEVDGGAGVLAGLALGYRLGDFRVEGEYFYRTTTYDDESDLSISGYAPTRKKEEEELEESIGAVDDVLSHNFFANLYYDFRSDSKFTPYLGFGVGVARVSLDYFSKFKRNDDPENIRTFNDRGVPDADKAKLHQTLAGTTSIASAKLSDTLFGYQVLAGMDYRVSEPVTIGLKFRWADFGEFESDQTEWDQLRSHNSTNGRGTRIRYAVTTDDIQFWGVSLNMKYQF